MKGVARQQPPIRAAQTKERPRLLARKRPDGAVHKDQGGATITRGGTLGDVACRDNHAKGSHCRDAYSGRP